MKRAVYILITALTTGASAACAASIDITPAPTSTGVVFKDFSGAEINTMYYYTGTYNFKPGWQYQAVSTNDGADKAGMPAFISPSRMKEKAAPDAWLILPAAEVEEGDRLMWEAKSVHYSARDSYDVMIAEGGDEVPSRDDFTLLTHVEREDYFFAPREILLSEYAGKKVYVAFVHNSKDGYMLALSRISLGTPSWGYRAERAGRCLYGADDGKTLEWTLTNLGETRMLKSVKAVESADAQNVVGQLDIDSPIAAAESVTLQIPFDAEVGTALKYDLVAEFSDGGTQVLGSDYLNVQTFRRRVLLEKFTGVWCNSCPKVVYPAHVYRHWLRNDGYYAETHVSEGLDHNAVDDYVMPINYCLGGDYPSLVINRTNKQSTFKAFDRSGYENAILAPCVADVKLSDVTFTNDGDITCTATVRVSEELDNTKGIYRVGFIITEKEGHLVQGDNVQKNAQGYGTNMSYGEINFLPAMIPADLCHFDNIVRGASEGGGTGIEGSLPAKVLVPGEDYEVTWEACAPVTAEDPEALTLVAYMNRFVKNSSSEPATIYNCDYTELKHVVTGVETTPETDKVKVEIRGERAYVATSEDYTTAELYDMHGNKVGKSAMRRGEAILTLDRLHGPGIIRLTGAVAPVTVKIMK